MDRVHFGEGAEIPSEQTDKATLISETEERIRTLSFAADLYEEIFAFMDAMTSRTYLAYDAAKGLPEADALRVKHITALSIRDDYRRTSKENRDDVELYRRLIGVPGLTAPTMGTERSVVSSNQEPRP